MAEIVRAAALCLVPAVFLGDQRIKNRIERNFKNGETAVKCNGLLLIHRHHNYGAVLNAGQKHQRIIRGISAAITAVLAVLFCLILGQKGNRLLKIGLAFLLGGAFSNTYDRLRRKYVVDYFSFGVKWTPLRRIVFNLADMSILIGALLILLAEK